MRNLWCYIADQQHSQEAFKGKTDLNFSPLIPRRFSIAVIVTLSHILKYFCKLRKYYGAFQLLLVHLIMGYAINEHQDRSKVYT